MPLNLTRSLMTVIVPGIVAVAPWVLFAGCHCWLVQQCRRLRRFPLLDKPAVAPNRQSRKESAALIAGENIPHPVQIPRQCRAPPGKLRSSDAVSDVRMASSRPWVI